MRFLRHTVHGLVLAIVNMISILAAFGLYLFIQQWIAGVSQIIVQGFLAAVLTLLGFTAWCFLVHQLFGERFWLSSRKEMMGVYLAALVWMPVLFVPLHFIASGYLTSFSNIMFTWAFQALVNLLALELVAWILPTASQ